MSYSFKLSLEKKNEHFLVNKESKTSKTISCFWLENL